MINNKGTTSFLYAFSMVFLPFSLSFILSCLFRTMHSVLIPSLENVVKIPTIQLGFLTSVYFFAQGIFQIPLGILLDRFGPKQVQVGLLFIATIGLILCAKSHSTWQIVLGHVIVGIGMAGGLMASLKIIVQWFPSDKLPILNGLMMTSGGLGILIAATPTSILAQYLGWTRIHFLFAGITLLIAVIILIVVPNTNKHLSIKHNSIKHQIKGVLEIYMTTYFWRVAPLISSILGSFIAFQSLWIENWMHDVNHFSQAQINNHLLIIGIGMTLSLLGSGYAYRIAEKLSITLVNILVFFAILFFVDEWVLMTQFHFLTWIVWFMYGFLSHKFNLCFTLFSNHYPKTHSGRANGALNVMIFLSAFLFQYLFGFIISQWSVDSSDNYPIESYQIAFGILFLIQFISLIWYVIFPSIIKSGSKIVLYDNKSAIQA